MLKQSHLKWWVLAATSGSLAMIFLDQSALPIALPSIQRELNLSAITTQWIINAYVLSLAVLIILGGRLGDKWGYRFTFLWGMAIFIVSSILCATALNGTSIVFSRALQGIGGALMIPASSPLLRTIVSAREFGKMVGLYAGIASIFLVLGPTLGGLLTTHFSWRFIFWINFPVALFCILVTVWIIPKKRVVHAKSIQHFDWKGFFALSLFLICFVFALMQGQIMGWTSFTIISCFTVSLFSLFGFIQLQRMHPHPFLDLTLLKESYIARYIWIITLVQVAYMSIIFWAIFLQDVFGFSSAKTGLFLLTSQVPILCTSVIAGRVLDRFGPRLPITFGTLCISIGSIWIGSTGWMHNVGWLCPGFIIFGIGAPFVSISVMSSVVSVAPLEKRGIINGIVSASRQIGGAIGLAMLAALIFSVLSVRMKPWFEGISSPTKRLNMHQLNDLLVGKTLPIDLNLSADQIHAAHQAVVHAYTLGFNYALFFVAFVSFIGFLIARKLPNTPIHLPE